MYKVNSPINFKQGAGKKFLLPSLTVPDQSLSPRQLLDRYVRGDELNGKEEIWDEEENSQGINLKTLDLVELQELRADITEKIDEWKKTQTKNKAKKADLSKEVKFLENAKEEEPN